MALVGGSEFDRRRSVEVGVRVQPAGVLILRCGLVLVIAWIGLMKFTEYEARGIQPLVAHSPLMGWLYNILTVRQFATALALSSYVSRF